MNNNTINNNPEYVSPRAVSVYGGGDAMDDFPVLKAFQQYIDAEQTKARKRLLAMGIFFGIFILVVVAIFVVLLINVSNRNQQLNDRLVEFAMRERIAAPAATSTPVVVQPPQDSATILALTSKIDEMNKKISEAQARADKAVAEADAKVKAAEADAAAAKPKGPSAEELEIQKLKAQLAEEKKKVAEEKARQREAELEAYRRKHYPELYEKPVAKPTKKAEPVSQVMPELESQDSLEEINDLLDDLDSLKTDDSSELAPISYFNETTATPAKSAAKAKAKAAKKKAKSPSKSKPAAPKTKVTTKENSVTISDGDTSLDWGIPD